MTSWTCNARLELFYTNADTRSNWRAKKEAAHKSTALPGGADVHSYREES